MGKYVLCIQHNSYFNKFLTVNKIYKFKTISDRSYEVLDNTGTWSTWHYSKFKIVKSTKLLKILYG